MKSVYKIGGMPKTSLVLADGEVAVIGGLTGSRGVFSRSSLFGFNVIQQR